jgi:hypothetical protein
VDSASRSVPRRRSSMYFSRLASLYKNSVISSSGTGIPTRSGR